MLPGLGESENGSVLPHSVALRLPAAPFRSSVTACPVVFPPPQPARSERDAKPTMRRRRMAAEISLESDLHHRALYASFDRFPSRKGSAVHIDRFARTLFEHSGGGLLYVLGGEDLPAYQREGAVEIVRYQREAEHVLERAAGYGERLSALLERLPDLEIAHF